MQQNPPQQASSDEPFAGLFNLHPQDALTFLHTVNEHLVTFTDSFKERIEVELEYSKSLIRISKRLNKHINPQKPSPLSYFSSAFKVQHEQRARHALELAEYLHTEIEVPCQTMLHEAGIEIKQTEKEIKKYYKDADAVDETYRKNLKKYYRSRQDWEEKLMNTIMSKYVPGMSPGQLQKLKLRLQAERADNASFEEKYISSLEAFNSFAERFNKQVSKPLRQISDLCLQELTLESTSLRKLIVSEINMFKNIEYDLLNISRQTQSLSPTDQLHCFTKETGSLYATPILSIYQEGPLNENTQKVDYKNPISDSLLESTLLKIEGSQLGWMLENKYNSTIRHSLQQAWNQFQGLQTSEDFMSQLEDCLVNNKVVESVPLDKGPIRFINKQEVFSIAFSVVCTLGSFIRPIVLDQLKQDETLDSLRKNVCLHHIYRFIAITALEELVATREYQLQEPTETQRIIMIIRLLIEESLKGKDIFVLRAITGLIFSVHTTGDTPLFLDPSIKDMEFWNQNDFWEAMIFEGTFQEISLLPLVSKSELKEIYLMRQKNIMFSALTTFCHYMAMLGCQSSQVHNLATRFCHIYGLYQDHRRDLARSIKSSFEKYQKVCDNYQQFKSSLESNEEQPENKKEQSQPLEEEEHDTSELEKDEPAIKTEPTEAQSNETKPEPASQIEKPVANAGKEQEEVTENKPEQPQKGFVVRGVQLDAKPKQEVEKTNN